MKRIIFALLMTVVSTAMWAVPARPGVWRTVTLTNGQEIKVQLCGDEHIHYWRDSNGVCYVEDSDSGLFKAADSNLLQQRANARRAKVNARRQNRMRQNRVQNRTAYSGTKKGLIILVQFSKLEFKAGNGAQALYQNVANTEGYSENGFKGSVSDYFKAQSFGNFILDFDVVGPYTLNNTYSYYGANDSNGDDKRPGQMIADALKAANADVDFSKYDWDGDGEVEQIYVLYAGKGEASGGSSNTIWPHEWELSESDYGTTVTYDGVVMNTYACGNELVGNSYDGIGTICHEFSHCLGYPDFYDTAYDGNYGMGGFDLMDSGSYNDDGFTPPGYTSYERWVAGWLEPTVLSNDTIVSDMKPLTEGGEAFVVYNEGHPDEYYLVENRQQIGYDKYIPSAGLLFIHVDYDYWLWYLNMVNTIADYTSYASYYGSDYLHAKNDHQRCTPIPSYQGYWSGGSVYTYPYGSRNSLTNTTTPAASVYNRNSDNSLLMNCAFTKITAKNNLTMSFEYQNLNSGGQQGGGDEPVNPNPETPEEGVLFYESFDECSGTGGNDGKWNGNIATKAVHTDNDGWTFVNAAGANQCLKSGSSNVVGVVTSPAITIDEEATLSFKAGAWNHDKDGTSLTLSIDGTGVTASETSFTMEKGAWTDYTVTLTGSGSIRLIFTPSNRFFLDEVKVFIPTTTGIKTTEQQADYRLGSPIYNLQGQFVGTRLDVLPRGIYIVGGKKIAK